MGQVCIIVNNHLLHCAAAKLLCSLPALAPVLVYRYINALVVLLLVAGWQCVALCLLIQEFCLHSKYVGLAGDQLARVVRPP